MIGTNPAGVRGRWALAQQTRPCQLTTQRRAPQRRHDVHAHARRHLDDAPGVADVDVADGAPWYARLIGDRTDDILRSQPMLMTRRKL